MKKTLLFFSLLMLSLAGAACALSANSLLVGVATDKPVYRPAEPIAMAVTILNREARVIQAPLTSSQVYDFYLYQGQQLIWQWSGDKVFAQMISSLTLEPQKPITYVYLLNPILALGKPLKPGHYQLVGVFCSNEKIISKPVTFDLKE